MEKEKGLVWAEIIDAHRIWPKFFMLVAWFCAVYAGYWYVMLPLRGVEETAFIGIVTAALAKTQDYYFQSGRKWGV